MERDIGTERDPRSVLPRTVKASIARPTSTSIDNGGSGAAMIVIDPFVSASMLTFPPAGSDRLVAGNGDNVTATGPDTSPAETSKNR